MTKLLALPFSALIYSVLLLTPNRGCSKSQASDENKLTAHPWRIREIRGVNANDAVYYHRERRGGNTQNFDDEYMVFNPDHTGTYHEQVGLEHPFTWSFNEDHTVLTSIVQFRPVTTLTWENLQLSANDLRYNESFSQYGRNAHCSVERIK